MSDIAIYEKCYYSGFVFIALVNFSPLKILAYFAPIIIIVPFFLFTEDRIRILKIFFIVLLIFFILLLFDLTIYREFIVQNYILAFLTYSTIYPILFLDSKKLANTDLLEKLLKFSAILFIIESIVGILQAINGFLHNGTFGGDNGDYVEGTIHIGLTPEHAFSNVMFAINMILIGLCLLLLIYVFNKKIRLRLFIGLLAIILASVVHAILLFATAVFVSYLLFRPRFQSKSNKDSERSVGKKYIVTLLAFGILSAAYFIGNNISQLKNILNNMILGNYPRAIITYNVVDDIPKKDPLAPLVGLGLGQFSSRASLIGSGQYLGGMENPRSAPLLKNEINPIAQNYIIYLMVKWANISWLGSTEQPFYSLLSVYSETGIIGLFILFCFIFLIFKRVRKNANENETKRFLSFVFFTGVLFIVILGIQSDYYEVPQAILIGVLLLKVIYSVIVYEPAEQSQ